MPFTLSHAAAVLPFTKSLSRWRALSAAVIGSMVPDFGYLLPWPVERVETHSFQALFTFALPVGLIAYWLFEYIVKPATREVLPDAGYIRSAPLATPDPIGSLNQWGIAILAIMAGAISHLVWDGFTHEAARGVRMLPMLDDQAVDIAGHSLTGYRLLQHGSSVAGLIVIVAIIGYSMRPEPGFVRPSGRALDAHARHLWMAIYAGVALLLAAISVLSIGLDNLRESTGGEKLEALAVGGLRGLAGSTFLVSFALHAQLRKVRNHRSLL